MSAAGLADLIVGSWSLIDYRRLKGGDVVLPFGADPVGFLQYCADGRVSATLAKRARPAIGQVDAALRGNEGEWAEAAMTYVAYTGTYRVDGDRVSHAVDASLYPNWTDTTLIRWASFKEAEGETRILLVTAPPGSDTDKVVSRLLWRRWSA